MKQTAIGSMSTTRPRSAETISSQRFLDAPASIKITYFSGADDYIDATDWIDMYDNISSDYNWTATNKIVRLGGYLRKHALVWYAITIKNYPVDHTTWAVYKDLFIKRFTPNTTDKTSSSRSDTSPASSVSREI